MKTIVSSLPANAYFNIEGEAYNQEFLLPTEAVGVVLRFNTVIPGKQASGLNSQPYRINLPDGYYIFVGGVIHYAKDASILLDLGTEVNISTGSGDYYLVRSSWPAGLAPGAAFILQTYEIGVMPPGSQNGFFLSTDADAAEAPDGDVTLSLFVIPI